MPCDLASAIEHAHAILHWQENLPAKDVPPVWMWHLDHELEDWFDALNSNDGSGPEDPDDEDVPMMRNALVRR